MTSAPGCSPVQALLDTLHARYVDVHDGEVATYIPELAKADPNLFGICLATADGFVYGLALDDHGADTMFSTPPPTARRTSMASPATSGR